MNKAFTKLFQKKGKNSNAAFQHKQVDEQIAAIAWSEECFGRGRPAETRVVCRTCPLIVKCMKLQDQVHMKLNRTWKGRI